jgi:hypothetical protein
MAKIIRVHSYSTAGTVFKTERSLGQIVNSMTNVVVKLLSQKYRCLQGYVGGSIHY